MKPGKPAPEAIVLSTRRWWRFFDRRRDPRTVGLDDSDLKALRIFSLPPRPIFWMDVLWVVYVGGFTAWLLSHPRPRPGTDLLTLEQTLLAVCFLWPMVVTTIQWRYRRRSGRRDIVVFEVYRFAVLLFCLQIPRMACGPQNGYKASCRP